MMKRIILASCIILAGCSSAPESEFVYEEPIVADDIKKEQTQTENYIKYTSSEDTSAPKEQVVTYPKYDVFKNLQRNDQHINKLYKNSTRKIYLTADGEKSLEELQNKVEKIVIEEEPEVIEEQEDYTSDCVTYCGEGYFYSHNGELLNGYERICIRYPLPCGEDCRKDWYIQSLIYDTNYTCYEAIQKDGNSEEPSKENAEQKEEKTEKSTEQNKETTEDKKE